MASKSMELHKKLSTKDIQCGIITLSDSKAKNPKEDISGDYIANQIKSKYFLKSKMIIPDEKDILLKTIEAMINKKIDVILTTGGTGLEHRDITIETVNEIFDKKINGFGEIFRLKSYEELGSGALLSRATAGLYKQTIIFSMPGSPDAVETGMKIIIDELPHLVSHAKK